VNTVYGANEIFAAIVAATIDARLEYSLRTIITANMQILTNYSQTYRTHITFMMSVRFSVIKNGTVLQKTHLLQKPPRRLLHRQLHCCDTAYCWIRKRVPNVVVPGVVVRFSMSWNFFISQPIVIKLRLQIGENILHNRTVSYFQADLIN